MPRASRTINKKHLTGNHKILCFQFPVSSFQFKGGFTLLEIVLALFLILAIITMLLSASGTLVSSRSSNLRAIAAKIESREIETLRKMDFDSLPASGSFADADLSKLPQGAGAQTLSSYQSSPDIKLITIQVSWVESSATKSLSEDTLIYRNGLK